MKKLRLLIIFSVLTCTFMALVACNLPAFSTPTNVRVDDGAYTLLWNEVKGARGYIVSINGDETETTRARLDISRLATDTEYTFRVKALGNRSTNSNSAWSEPLTVFKEYENGLSYKYINGNTEYELTGIGTAGGSTIDVPAIFRGKPVTRISNAAFYNNARITKITLPDTITHIGDNAFRNCTYLSEIVIPDSVTSMGINTFQGCRSLTKVVIPGSLKVIPEKAFANCRALTDVTIGEGVEEIGANAFDSCANTTQPSEENPNEITSFTTLNLPDSLKTIGEYAFSNCYRLESVSGNHIETIDKRAFQMCDKITSINLGTSLKEIGDYAFTECRSITSIVIADTAEKIGNRAFLNCLALEHVEIGDNLTYVGREAFNSTALWEATEDIVYIGTTVNGEYVDKWIVETKDHTKTSVTIKDGIVGIASYGFYMLPYRDNEDNNKINYNSLQSVDMADSVKYINDYAFRSCANMTTFNLGNGVETISPAAFYNCGNLIDFNIDKEKSSLKYIGDYAFADCVRLGELQGSGAYVKDFNFPASLTQIGYNAFENTYFETMSTGLIYVGGWVVGCVSDESVSIVNVEVQANSPFAPTGSVIPTIGIADFTFYTKDTLESIVLPSTLKYIGANAFYKCSALMSITIPEGITEIRDYTFFKCESLTEVSLPSTITTIGDYAFYKCAFASIDISNVVTLGDAVFSSTDQLRKVEFSDKIESFGARVFSGSGISNIKIPDTITVIPENAFANCPNLNTVQFGNNITEIGRYAFNNCSKLANVFIPSNVKTIGDYAFRKCESLINLTISEGVEYIGASAFYGCKYLDSITLPSTLKYIGNQAFRSCEKLTSLIINDGSIETMGAHVFYGCTYLTIYTDMTEVPEGWNERWNSAYRPVAFGCTLGYENSFYYVESFVRDENTLINSYLRNIIEAPKRVGYTFVGWRAEDGTMYDAGLVYEAPYGTNLTAVWEVNA